MNLPSLKRFALQIAGGLSVFLAVLGIFLPLLPTTPFLLLAAFCWSRSSPRFHGWLLGNRYFGGRLTDYLAGRGIPVRQKIVTLAFLWVSIGVSAILVARLWVGLILLACAVGVTVHLMVIPNAPRDPKSPARGQ